MAQAGRDDNRVPTLLGLSSVDGVTPTTAYINAVTHGLLVNSYGSQNVALQQKATTNDLIVTLDGESVAVTGTFWQSTQPVSLASVPSHAVTNAGTFAVQPGAALTGPGNPTIDSYTHASINLAAGANQVLVSSAASKQIWVYGIGFTVNAAGTVSFQDESDTAITGVMPFATNSGMVVNPSGNFAMPIWKLGTDKDLEVDIVTSELDGFIDYAIVSV